ncbi:hypothetical protein [Sphingomonas aerolata]|uniref:ApeA N-terminal domain 1-containing protein n=1 Tax=Sphingomonas aerolata TaxID=185951 RepID=UPI003A5BBD3B
MAKSYSLDDSFSFEGFWWLPNKPDEHIAGTLSFSQESGALLQLLGIFGAF